LDENSEVPPKNDQFDSSFAERGDNVGDECRWNDRLCSYGFDQRHAGVEFYIFSCRRPKAPRISAASFWCESTQACTYGSRSKRWHAAKIMQKDGRPLLFMGAVHGRHEGSVYNELCEAASFLIWDFFIVPICLLQFRFARPFSW
jgi:hypothetical protein